jgi:hypothetical protein
MVLSPSIPFSHDASQDHIQLICVNQEVLFFNQRDGPFYPTLKLLHKCPSLILPPDLPLRSRSGRPEHDGEDAG